LDDDTLVIRVNPSLALDVEVQAGSCRIRGVDGPIRAEVQAGSAKIEDFKSALNLSVQAGSVKAAGRLDEGESRISCDAGSVTLQLESGSSVRISAQATMGKIELPNGISVTGGRRAQQVVLGDGTASLVINSNMGSVKVSANQ
jgi:ferric-dicitrate binding protein FerR (iron transport regulator)